MATGLLANPTALGATLGLLGATVLASMAYMVNVAARARAKQARIDVYIRRADGTGPMKDARDRRVDARRKAINSKMKSLQESKRHGSSRIGAVRVHIMRAGLTVSLAQFWGFCIIFGLMAAGIWDVMKLNPTMMPFVFFFFTILLPQAVLRIKAKRRQKAFTAVFSTAIDIIVRGLSSGLPVQECFRIIGREIADPCGSEFRTVIDEVNAGLTLSDALYRSYQRMPTQELRFFATVIAVQAQTGGNLAEILGNISGVLRGRAALKEKIKALSSEAKASAMIVGALPFFVGGVLTLMNYPYISQLWTTTTGTYILAGAVCMMSTGMFIMNRMGKLDM